VISEPASVVKEEWVFMAIDVVRDKFGVGKYLAPKVIIG
jgi:hypothetical protein